MSVILGALTPLFLLIALGYVFRRVGFPGGDFWRTADRFAYYALFTPLIFKSIATAPLDRVEPGPITLVLVGAMLANSALGLVLGRALRLNGPQMGSFLQCPVRFNTYVAVGAAFALQGQEGLGHFSILIAVIIPLANVISVWGLARFASGRPPTLAGYVRPLATNPFILAVAAGLVFNLLRLPLPFGLGGAIDSLAAAALAFGLLCVGAGLDLQAFRSGGAAVIAGVAVKLVFLPLLVHAGLSLAGITGLTAWAAMLYATVPLAPAAYVLSRQMGGDAPLMAALITVSTLVSTITMPLTLALFAPLAPG